jgi:hypothetical protein
LGGTQCNAKQSRTLLDQASFDELEEFYADLILIKGVPPHRAISAMVSKFPDAKGLDYTIALCFAASVIEAEVANKASIPLPDPAVLYKMAALLALDLLELQERNEASAFGHDLIAHWQRNQDKLFG